MVDEDKPSFEIEIARGVMLVQYNFPFADCRRPYTLIIDGKEYQFSAKELKALRFAIDVFILEEEEVVGKDGSVQREV